MHDEILDLDELKNIKDKIKNLSTRIRNFNLVFIANQLDYVHHCIETEIVDRYLGSDISHIDYHDRYLKNTE